MYFRWILAIASGDLWRAAYARRQQQRAALCCQVPRRPRDDPATGGRKVRDGKPLEPLPSGPGKGSGKLEPFVAFCAELAELAELIEPDPDIPLVELQAALPAADGVPCSTSGTDALLRCHEYTCKRIHISKGLIARGSPMSAKRPKCDRHDMTRYDTI